MSPASFTILLGSDERKPHLRLEVVDYQHPEVAEPDGLDLLTCLIHAHAEPVRATFPYAIRVDELAEVRAYLAQINSGNGPPAAFAIAGGLFELSFAPSRRGPVLCAVRLKSIDTAHVRVEFLLTLEPEGLTRALADLAHLDRLRF